MSPRALAWVLAAWALSTCVLCAAVHRAFALSADAEHPIAVVASVWQGGKLVARAVLARDTDHDAALDAAAALPGATLVHEAVVATGPVAPWPSVALSLSFVPGLDGLSVTYGGRTAYVTPDDLLAAQAYDHGVALSSMQLSFGLDLPVALAKASDALGVPVRDLVDHGTLRRFRVARARPPAAITADTLTRDDALRGATAMARYLARGVDQDGRFRYLVNAPTDQTLPGYDWPRHAGATYFLAQAAGVTHDADLGYAALRAAALLRDHAMVDCGAHRCIADEPYADVGSTALAVLAFVEVARTKLDPGYALVVPELTAFLRSQQRADGEFMHVYERPARRPLDIQLLYYSGEATFALARAHALLGDPRDLDAATRGLAHLAGPAWSFFGSRYYWGEEHWTCQAMDELWGRAPAEVTAGALDFCLGWQAFNRRLQYGEGETLFDGDGAYGVGPFVTPRLTPAGSRSEAAVATLDAAIRAEQPQAERDRLERQARRSLAMLLRHELPAGRAYLLADPLAVEGAMPGSEVDWQLRIDYAQHAGCALVRWIELSAQSTKE
ncbi:MAG TPA: hypothetical protein VGG39_07225 [Polyangiaceae bacterium]|jgi:hypothetical protein